MKEKSRNIIFYLMAAVLVAVGIHLTQEFRFYNIAANELFIYDWPEISGALSDAGGLATLTASFLSQFFCLPLAGTIILSGLYILIAWIIWKILSRMNDRPIIKGLAFLPVVFLFLCMENDYYRFQGHIAFLFVMAALAAYVSIPKDRMRYVAGLVLIPVLYQTAGSVAVVFAVTTMLWEVMERGWKGLVALAYPAVMFLTAWLYVESSLVRDFEHALTPFMYYDWPSTYFFPAYAWAMIPLLLLAAWAIKYLKLKPSYARYVSVIGLAVSLFLAGNFYSQVHSRNYYRMIQEQYWAENGDWDKIIKTADRRQPTFLVSYLNLALAHKGLLVQNFKYYNPQDLSSLMYPTPNLKTGLSLQSNVYMAWGYLGSARKAAFDGNVVTPGSCHPRQLQALVKMNLVMGAHDVAEKYISILERTLFYKGWASSMRAFLGNEDAIKADNELGDGNDVCLTSSYRRICKT